ncbi:hypothetical protein VPMG_00027 [Vibrio phage VBP32]|uniref:Homing endonuclease n=2 Tax=Stoningtonvirus VBP47 TaxID=2846606 RepID=M4SPA3_9CAUD|nr:hypothetical protein VPNG_00101 [Vibrio phage VBP47]YP_007676517.1 hypothetical protein VPMG_00027 [Vibrio phage VBP32]AGH57125.1 hypothetical protein VPNG_00101 [Vibrio phage VBP47]AGH57166.1 hypothetical protein VPMG_00027 [Vibrio phage VBP32]
MHHYTYKINYSDGKAYIGVRSCECLPEEDSKYIGSSKYTPNDLILNKEIIKCFTTREEAVEHEIALHEAYNVAESDDYYNRSKQTAVKFDTTGVKIERTTKHNQKIKEALTGRKRSPEECAALSKAFKGKPKGAHAPEVYAKGVATRRANGNMESPMKGKVYSDEDTVRLYADRCKYGDTYTWIHKESGEIEKGTCQEMGLKYGVGVKPTGRFRNIIKGKAKSYKGWRLLNASTN